MLARLSYRRSLLQTSQHHKRQIQRLDPHSALGSQWVWITVRKACPRSRALRTNTFGAFWAGHFDCDCVPPRYLLPLLHAKKTASTSLGMLAIVAGLVAAGGFDGVAVHGCRSSTALACLHVKWLLYSLLAYAPSTFVVGTHSTIRFSRPGSFSGFNYIDSRSSCPGFGAGAGLLTPMVV